MLPDTDPTGTVTITRRNLSAVKRDFTLDREAGTVSGVLVDGTRTVNFNAWLPEDSAAGYAGNYTFAMKSPSSGDAPRGHSVGALKVTPKGAVSGVIRLADGTPAVTLSGPLGEGGNLPVFALLYTKLGSLHGTLNIGAGSALDGSSLSWFKHPQTGARSYPGGFGPLALATVGRTYAIPLLNGIALGLPAGAGNARLTFAEGGAPDPVTRLDWLSFEIQKGSPAKVVPPAGNPGQVKLTIVPGSGVTFTPGMTGSFTGSFKLTDADTSVTPNKPLTRTASFSGMIVDDGTGPKGYGFFNLAEMPSAGPPKTTAATTRLLSGTVDLRSTAP